jgi:hypothetical protein
MSVQTNQTERPTNIITRVIGNDGASARRFIATDGTQCLQGGRALGVTKEEGLEGDEIAVVTEGTVLVVAGEPLAAGVEVTSDGLGKAVNVSGDEYVNGVTLNAQADAGQLVEIQLGGAMAVKAAAGITTTTSTTTTTTTSTTVSA